MDIRVSGHQVETGEALKQHVSDRLEAIAEKYFSRTISAQVTFRPAPHGAFHCDIVCHVMTGLILKGAGEAQEAHPAFDQASDRIVALYERNRERQMEDGAPPERTLNIPNGIDLPRMQKVRAARGDEIPPVACLIGRVVPIKDVKTFLRAMRTLVNVLPEAEGWIAGPEDEDKEYAKECHGLVASLGLEKNVKFLGHNYR